MSDEVANKYVPRFEMYHCQSPRFPICQGLDTRTFVVDHGPVGDGNGLVCETINTEWAVRIADALNAKYGTDAPKETQE